MKMIALALKNNIYTFFYFTKHVFKKHGFKKQSRQLMVSNVYIKFFNINFA